MINTLIHKINVQRVQISLLQFTELTPLSDVELSEKEQEEILSSYDQERRVSSKSNSPTEGNTIKVFIFYSNFVTILKIIIFKIFT
jgi:hypothetical protein